MERTGARGRWERLLAKQAGSGLSIAEFCRRNEVSAASFYQWRRKLGQKASVAEAFVPVAIVGAATLRVEFPVGVVMQLPAGDDRSLMKLVSLLLAGAEKTP